VLRPEIIAFPVAKATESTWAGICPVLYSAGALRVNTAECQNDGWLEESLAGFNTFFSGALGEY
jgi:hypothetical protein